METKTVSTKAEETQTNVPEETKTNDAVLISKTDAEEYRTYKQQKALATVVAAMQRSQGSLLVGEEMGEDIQRVCERAVRYRQAAVQTPLSKLAQAAYYLGETQVKLDCVVGGTGETHVKVKAYETRLAVKKHAKEITLVITPSLVDACRYGEIRREIKRVRRAAKRAQVKVRIEKTYTPTILSRLARLCSETGVKYFSVPYFSGCERLRMDVRGGCNLEVYGVESLLDYQCLVGAGVGRIVTNRVAQFYAAWIKTCNEKVFTPLQQVQIPKEKEVEEQKNEEKEEKTEKSEQTSEETEYQCRLEGTQLKFL